MAENTWQISDHDRPIIEQAIGAAVLDALRGQKDSLVQMYDVHGGIDPGTKEAPGSYEDRLNGIDGSRHAGAIGGAWPAKFAGWNMAHPELARVERAVGAARLARAEGRGPTTAREHYERLGGDNPTTLEVLSTLAGT